MSMNYVGSVTVLDRGDAPAQAVMDRNARSLAQRVADETRDELEKVLSRVENIYGSFEMSSQYDDANLEYVNDIAELEELIKDQVKKRKYQQQVTIFVVGFQDVCGQRLRILQQVNEFFMENSKSYEEEDWFPRTPDIDLDDVADKIDDSLKTAHNLTNRLGELNKEIVDCLAAYAEKKATNRGKKKLEKALQAAKDEVGVMHEKLLIIQKEIDEKEEKTQALFKQLEVKNLELQRYKTAAEVAKKNVQDSERLQADIKSRDEKIQELRQQVNRLEIEVTSSNHNQEMSQSKLESASEENQHRLVQLTKEVEEGKLALEEAQRDISRLHEGQVSSLKENQKAELEELRNQHNLEIQQLTGERSDTASDVVKHFDLDPSEPPSQATTREGSRQVRAGESRSNKSSRQGSVASKKSGKSPNRQSDSKPGSRTSKQEAKEYAETAVQDQDGNPALASVEKSKAPSSKGRRSKAGLAPVQETDAIDLENAFDLMDDAAWGSVSGDQIQGRFAQYRKLCKRRVAELEEQLQLTQAKTQRKVLTLKAQFQEHKGKWEAERKLLIEQVSQAHKLQNEAEKEADAAMSQLEDFINEQEKLEQDEEVKRKIILRKTDAVTAETKAAGEQGETTPVPQRDGQETEQDMTKLMQQTDDAKVQELNARMTSGAMSAPPAVEGEESTADKSTDRLSKTPDNENQNPADSESFQRQKSTLSNVSSHKSTPTIQSVKSGTSKKSAPSSAGTLDPKDPNDPEMDPSETGTMNRASQTPSEKTQRLTPNTDLVRENTSISVTSGLLEVPQSPATGKFDNTAEEEIRASSARSRASLRNQFRQRLEETKKVVDERRTKSPGITIPTPRSMDEDELIIEDDDEVDIPLPDDLKEYRNKTMEIGTSPPPGLRQEDSHVSVQDAKFTPTLSEHPVVQDFLKVYDGVVHFKDALAKILVDKDQMSASQILSDLDTLKFDKSAKIKPQITNMTYNIYFMLEEIAGLLTNVLVVDREPMVSSLMNVSRDPTKGTLMRDETETSVNQVPTRGSQRSDVSDTKTSSTVKELQDQYHRLTQQFEDETKRHEEQHRHNTVVMMEMQDTINDLQRELSTLGRTAKRSRSATPNLAQRSPQLASPETSIMFTRLDSERNAKIMKKAVMDDRLGTDRYKEAVSQMNQYVSLPAQRLAHLVSKYVHHCRMKAIEENVKKSESLSENVFEVLDKMEALQNERARKWAEHMDDLGASRLKLAGDLMETLDTIEQESGLFLIKPMYSFRGREMKQKYVGKLSRPVRPRRAPPSRDNISALAPAPTPSSNIRHIRDERIQHKVNSASSLSRSRPEPLRPLEGDTGGLAGASMAWVGQSPRQTWSFSSSQAKNVQGDPLNLYNTPRILELDINRMLIGQNNISSLLPQPITEDRLVNASQNNLRSYVTVNRPVASPTTTTTASRPRSSGTPRDSAPPTTPQQLSSAGKKKVRVAETDLEMPPSLKHPRSPPLPPISAAEPPHSPSGSSERQSPPLKDQATETHGKSLTRESSRMTSTSASEDY